MKKNIFILMILVVFILNGCSGEKQNPIEQTDQNGGMEINVSAGQSDNNMSLPEAFPKEVFPLPDDINIVNVNGDKVESMSITFATKMNFDEAIIFSKKMVEGGVLDIENKTDAGYLLIGKKDGYDVTITVSKYNGDNISILFNVSKR